MPLPERLRIVRALLTHEIRCLLASKALWAMLLVLGPLLGYGFLQAMSLFAQASQSALAYPALAAGMTPLDGIFVPTFGALYLVVTLLFPFVVIRVIGQDKQSGAAKLSAQFPLGMTGLLSIKFIAAGCAWCLALLPGLSAIVIWRWLGGHCDWPELLNLLLGHALYGLVIAAIACFAAAIAESVATAAIIALALTLGCWVLDFAAGNGSLSGGHILTLISPTAALRQFERGEFSLPQVLAQLVMANTLFVVSMIWLPSGRALLRKLKLSSGALAVMALSLALVSQAAWYRDFSADRRNSFSPRDEAVLAQMDKPLTLTVHLTADDSRLQEMEANLLAKLRRLLPNLTVIYAPVERAGSLGAANDEQYGLISYDYAGQRAQSRSNSEPEILAILHELAGVPVALDDTPPYPGYPMVASAQAWRLWFYLMLPLLTLMLWWQSQRSNRAFHAIRIEERS